MSIQDTLIGRTADEYGEHHQEHTVEIYKTYLELTDRISARRQGANSFFLTINTALVGLVSYASFNTPPGAGIDSYLLIGATGIFLCLLWYRMIKSYRQLNSARFAVVHEIEKHLPLRPYDAEWTAVGHGKDPTLYRPFTQIEIAIPWLFAAVHVYVVLRSIPWTTICP